ncbi:hypothetical protein C2U69_14840 [Cupriavidus pinatubonensis]|nr:hypothetical protein C2U69_14840 [Cupriavidus pinatubonensis]
MKDRAIPNTWTRFPLAAWEVSHQSHGPAPLLFFSALCNMVLCRSAAIKFLASPAIALKPDVLIGWRNVLPSARACMQCWPGQRRGR